MKKLLAVILSPLLILSLTACQKGESNVSNLSDTLFGANADIIVEQANAYDIEKEAVTPEILKDFHDIIQTQTPDTDKKEDTPPITNSQIFEGKGTENNPYIIKTVEELVLFSEKINTDELNNGEWFALGADIDMKGVKFTPVGNSKNRFASNFNGRGFTISNLTPELVHEDFGVNQNHCCGFFGVVGDAEIKNLRLENVNITYTYDSQYFSEIGILAGGVYPKKACKITDCVVNGVINVETGTSLAGGIAGDVFIAEGATLSFERLQSNTKIQLRSDTVHAGAVTGSFIGRGEGSFSDICAQSEILYDARYKSYIGAFGIVTNLEDLMNVSNCFFKINTNSKYYDDFHPLIGGFIDSQLPSGTFKFTNVFGYMNDCEQLYELPPKYIITEENCGFAEVLPENSNFSTEIWDITNRAEPFIKFN